MSLHDSKLEQIFKQDKSRLELTQIPIVTVSGTFKEDLKNWHGEANENISTDVVFSRAHFSMAYGTLQKLWNKGIDYKKGWLVDPTNFVSSKNWHNISLTEDIGKLIARIPVLKMAKDLIDRFGRKKLPILKSITPPLLYLFEDVHQPILSFHVAAGNILAKLGKNVVQVITDPHVRDEYLTESHLANMRFCVFDEETKFEALEKAFMSGIELDPNRVIVTGPPIDQRIIASRENKTYDDKRPLRILLTTGGLGTNKTEIGQLLEQLLPTLRKQNRGFELMLYAGTQKDFVEMATDLAREHRIKINRIDDVKKAELLPLNYYAGQLTLLYHPQIFDANEIIVKAGFPWADCIITKPSGDMAYDAVASGAFVLTLQPWGVWEERIEDIFWQKGIARKAEVDKIVKQLEALKEIGWIKSAGVALKDLDPTFLHGIEKIVEVVRS